MESSFCDNPPPPRLLSDPTSYSDSASLLDHSLDSSHTPVPSAGDAPSPASGAGMPPISVNAAVSRTPLTMHPTSPNTVQRFLDHPPPSGQTARGTTKRYRQPTDDGSSMSAQNDLCNTHSLCAPCLQTLPESVDSKEECIVGTLVWCWREMCYC
nr:uncharacterized protein LOC128687477 [Cherax quadricarinatus]